MNHTAPLLHVNHPLLASVITDQGGETFRENAFWHAYVIAQSLLERFSLQDPQVISFPRGGVATGVGVKRAFKGIKHQFTTLPFGKHGLDQTLPLVDLDEKTDLILVDGVIATGSTLIRYLQLVREKNPHWQGRLFIISNMAAEFGYETLIGFCKEYGLELCCLATGYLVPPTECIWKEIGGKRIYFVGVSQSIGDFGDMAIKDLSAQELANWDLA
ncbi:MAG: hypothetical protein KC422_08995 [Trueperaceae bacterium]|nr:hypothetical protein [Trueperaceae bacterium]